MVQGVFAGEGEMGGCFSDVFHARIRFLSVPCRSTRRQQLRHPVRRADRLDRLFGGGNIGILLSRVAPPREARQALPNRKGMAPGEYNFARLIRSWQL